MKRIHTAIFDKLLNYFSWDQAEQLAFCALEFGFKTLEELKFNIWDHVVDYYPEKKSEKIARECIENISLN